MKFTFDNYKKMISLLKEQGYSICDYHDFSGYARCCILRHDVDFSLERALELATLENQIGVKSTYFVLLSSDFYNIASLKNTRIIKKIKELGHDIGLHYDEAKYENNPACATHMEENIYSEIKTMESILGIDICSVSMHRPSKNTLMANYDFGDIINSYSRTFFENFKYVSDSRCFWREDVFEIIKSNKYARIHILTHPFWYHTDEKSGADACKEFIQKACYERYDEMSMNIKNFKEFMKEDKDENTN